MGPQSVWMAETLEPPPDWPKTRTLPGSPPNSAMLSRTQRRAAIMSRLPTLPLSASAACSAATRSLFAAAQAETPIQVMFQLGETAGQLLGVHMPAVVPELPKFDDTDRILRWRFENSRAQGTVDDEIAVGFG